MLCSTSESRGTWESTLSPLHSSDAAKSGSTLFFAAGSRTVPSKGLPPRIDIYSVKIFRPPQNHTNVPWPTVCSGGGFGEKKPAGAAEIPRNAPVGFFLILLLARLPADRQHDAHLAQQHHQTGAAGG